MRKKGEKVKKYIDELKDRMRIFVPDSLSDTLILKTK